MNMIQKMVLFNFILLIHFYLLIISTGGAPVPTDDQLIDEQESREEEKSLLQCQHVMTYTEIQHLLEHSLCTSALPMNSLKNLRNKRDDTNDGTENRIFALQSTINDHHTVIDDHRKMIHYLMNNTVNITHLNQYYMEQHSQIRPIWKSWRDVSLVVLIILGFCGLLALAIIRFHPLDLLISFILRRHAKKQQQQQHNKVIHPKNKVIQQKNYKNTEPVRMSTIPVSTIEQGYLHYDRDSNSSV